MPLTRCSSSCALWFICIYVILAATASAPQVEEPPREEQEDNGRRVQADTTRCWSCNKKVGLLGFKCRCDYVFCSSHRYVLTPACADRARDSHLSLRYSDKHECPFDYKSMQKAALQKANPVIKGSKLEKI